MIFPPFEEFINALDSDTVAGIMKDANNAAKLIDPQELHFSEDAPALQALSQSFQVSLELLAVYHKWLEQHV